MFEWLQGKKTYITGISTVITTIAALLTGGLTLDAGLPTIVTALLGMTIGAKIDRAAKDSK